MKRRGGTFLRGWGVAVLAAMTLAAASGQVETPAPITQVAPVASPEGSAAAASPEATISPTPAPAAVEAVVSPSPMATPMNSPSPSATPAPAVSGTAPALSGTSASVSGTAAGMTAVPSPTPPSPYSIEIDLETQRAYLLKDGEKMAEAPISSGRAGHLTPTGNFEVIEKDLNHFSNLYGKIVEKESGRVVKAGADVAMPVPKGCKFVPAPMKWFMRFDGAAGMHAGILPGYPASHGCVRMPAAKAELFYETVEVGTPVHVFGTTPTREMHEEEPHRRTVVMARGTPGATPKPRHGWWPF